MKRLFFIGFFFFGVIFSVQPQAALAAAGDSCSGDNMGWSGTCQTITACGVSNADSSASCSSGLICCNSSTGTGGGTAQSVCVGKSQGAPCVGPNSGEQGTCRAVPTVDSPLNCVVNVLDNGGTLPGASTGGGSFYDPNAGRGATPCPGGEMRSGICFPTGTGLSSAPVGLLLMRLMNWLLAILGTLAIIAFVISGIQYLVSAGNEDMIETAKRNMWYSIVGVVVALSGWIIIITIDQVLRCSFVFDIASFTICI